MRAICGSLLVVAGGWASAAAAPALKGGGELEGTWALVSAEHDPALGRIPEGLAWAVAGGKLTVTPKGGGRTVTYALKYDPATDPKQIDLVEEVGGRKVVLRGIYRLDKERLTICLGVAVGDAKVVESGRPGAFEAGKDVQLLTLERGRK